MVPAKDQSMASCHCAAGCGEVSNCYDEIEHVVPRDWPAHFCDYKTQRQRSLAIVMLRRVWLVHCYFHDNWCALSQARILDLAVVCSRCVVDAKQEFFKLGFLVLCHLQRLQKVQQTSASATATVTAAITRKPVSTTVAAGRFQEQRQLWQRGAVSTHAFGVAILSGKETDSELVSLGSNQFERIRETAQLWE